ncbi:ATP-dependent RecD-like DNA helicase [Chlamydiales bacterium STE3]|nr:ATP-dependent RecD-like DNA helicase [Chlamydiales bacterium STE3]
MTTRNLKRNSFSAVFTLSGFAFMEQVFGVIERITFQNDENGYTVAKINIHKQKELVCIVGFLPLINPGVTVRCEGEWRQHLVHGQQFEVKSYSIEAPANLLGIKKYLGSGLVKGIGPVYAEKIVDYFGLETLNIIDKFPARLNEIKGIGKKKINLIATCWADQKSIRDVMVFLQGHGVSPAFAQKIYKVYQKESIKKVTENPFQLARDIFGIGFKTADTLASKLNILKDSTVRIDAGVEYVLSELSNDGHVCYPVDEFLNYAEKLLEVPSSMIEQRLHVLKQAEYIEIFKLVFDTDLKPFIWLKSLFNAEIGIAREIKRLNEEPSVLRKVQLEKAVEWVQEKLQIELAEQQIQAVKQGLSEKVQVITGGPGTGKSTITKAILHISEKLTSHILLAAPTGRAAKRMSEITGKTAKTIHSLLEFDFKKGGFKRCRENPLECDLIIVDEASMIDTPLMYNLLKAIPSHARLILIGDVHQLPSVGPGNVLKEMISSKRLPVTILTEIFRQAKGSKIILNAHLINNGLYPDIRHAPDSDFFFIEAAEVEQVLKEIVTLAIQRLPQKYNLHPLNDIQVLAPMKKGMVGTENLNAVLQQELNAKDASLMRFGRKFMVGDKVMQIRNNYQKEVFNGDVGRIVAIDFIEQSLLVCFDDKEILYESAELDELVLAYAVSVHKYQGSECPCIVMPVHTTHFKLLQRNLLYTGVTRGKRLVVLVGTKKALAMAVKNDEVKKRYTGLKSALLGVL